MEEDEPRRVPRRVRFAPSPHECIDTGDQEETLDPEIRAPVDSDFIVPQSLEKVVDTSKIFHKFLPKQGDLDRLIKPH